MSMRLISVVTPDTKSPAQVFQLGYAPSLCLVAAQCFDLFEFFVLFVVEK